MNTDKIRLECTGERVIEDDYKTTASRYLIYLFHIATYRFCFPYIKQKKVLEFGSGSGYGTHLISPECQQIIGIDISEDAIEYAKTRYTSENLKYQKINDIQSEPLPFIDNEFDVVISFQVIEHILKVDKFLSEIQRVLRKNGIFIVATPDRSTRLFPGQKPWNIYHVIEYGPGSFYKAVSNRFPDTDLYGMSASEGIINIELNRTRLLRFITYVFTFPFCPEWYRQSMLKILKLASSPVSRFSNKKKGPCIDGNLYGFNIDDIMIKKNSVNSVNIVSVSTNTK